MFQTVFSYSNTLLHGQVFIQSKTPWTKEKRLYNDELWYRYVINNSPKKILYQIPVQLNKFESPSHSDTFCHLWFKFTQWFLRWKSLNFVNLFSLFYYWYYLRLEKNFFCQVWLIFSQWFRAHFHKTFVWIS